MSVDLDRVAVDDRGVGPAVLLVHGQPGRAADWEPVSRQLAADHRVLALDRPGYGATGGPAMGMVANADLLASLLRRRAAWPATVVGHSWGGGVAVLLAACHPELVAGLVLVGAVGGAGSVGLADRVLAVPGVGEAASSGLLLFGNVTFPVVRRWASRLPAPLGPYLAASLPDGRFAVGRDEHHRLRRSFLAEQRFLIHELPLVATCLRQVRTPTTVVTGAWDTVVPPAASRALAEVIPGAELVTLPEVGHLVFRDAPVPLAAAVRTTARAAGVA